jgi:hypothetical protein
MNEPAPLFCDRCLREMRFGQGEFYLVRIEAVLDPTPPEFTEEDLARNVTAELNDLVRRLEHLPGREAMEQIHRKLTLYLCPACYQRWIENPTGSE